LQSAGTDRLDVADVNLVLAAWLVHAERASHGDAKPVLRAKLQAARLIAKAHATDLGLRVFEREIQMSRLRRAIIGDFAFQPNVRKGSFEELAYARVLLADFPHAPLGHQVEKTCLAHKLAPEQIYNPHQ
jgi:hypothetical protein